MLPILQLIWAAVILVATAVIAYLGVREEK